MKIIVDACVAIKWFYKEILNEKADELLEGDYTVCAPDFLLLEFSNFLLRKRRKGEITSSESKETQAALFECIANIYPIDNLIQRAIQISYELDHSPYDCIYLATAEANQSILVTADRQFYERVIKSPYSHLITWIEQLQKLS